MNRLLSLLCGVLILLALPAAAAEPALGEMRLWKDTSGGFQVRARLVELQGDAVLLRKADDKEITVPLKKLSDADQAYVEKITAPKPAPSSLPASSAAATPSVPRRGLRKGPPSKSVGNQAALPDSGRIVDIIIDRVDGDFEPDPADAAPPADPGTVVVCPIQAVDKVSAPRPVDAGCRKLLVSVAPHAPADPKAAQGRVYLVDWIERQADVVWESTKKTHLLDHDPDSGHSLLIEGVDAIDRGGELVVVKGLAEGGGEVVYRRSLPTGGSPVSPNLEWAKLLSGSHLAAIVNETLFVWDLPAARLLYRINGVPARLPPAVSPNGVFLAVVRDGTAAVIDAATGKLRRRLTQSGWSPALDFDPAGQRLAMCDDSRFQVWDCAADKIVAGGITTEFLGSNPVRWVGPRTLLSMSGRAVDTELGMVLWWYGLPNQKGATVAAGKAWLGGDYSQCQITAIDIPHLPVGHVAGAILGAGDDGLLMRPGMPVSIVVDNRLGPEIPIDEQAIRRSLGESSQAIGWVVQENAPTQLVARLERAPQQELKFRDFRNARSVTTATIRPFKAELDIRRGTDLLWTKKTENRVGPLLMLREGESVQQGVSRMERPEPEFFARLHIPPRIPRTDGDFQPGFSSLQNGSWSDAKLPRETAAPPTPGFPGGRRP